MFLLATIVSTTRLERMIDKLLEQGASLGLTLIKAFLIFIIGHYLIKLINKIIKRILARRDIEMSVKTFVGSLVNVVLTILLIISVVGALGVQTASFAALLASAGVAVGMALSGNLSNFAGGLIILLFKPFKVGDYIEGQGTGGTVKEIQIFHTILVTIDNRTVYIPNGALSSGAVVNFSRQDTRRIEWTFSIDYGENYDKVKQVIESILARETRILPDPVPFIALNTLADSSVNVIVRVWVKSENYWNVYYDINQAVYTTFNEQGIDFPFPQLTIHKGGE
ncbi:MAG: mechanosensitive ion channel [Parabacteroides sp.]|nr:mechanosensitive ion channel [Parabacteroides sp.]